MTYGGVDSQSDSCGAKPDSFPKSHLVLLWKVQEPDGNYGAPFRAGGV